MSQQGQAVPGSRREMRSAALSPSRRLLLRAVRAVRPWLRNGSRIAVLRPRRGRAVHLTDDERQERWLVPLIVRASVMVGLLSALAIWVSIPGNLPGGDGVRFAEGTPTSQISAAGSVSRRGLPDRSDTRSSRRSPASIPAPAPTGEGTDTPSTCHISYSVGADSSSRFTVVIVIANTGATKIQGWTLHWDFPPKQKIIYGWNAMVTNGADGMVATDIDTNAVIAPGGNVTIGFAGKRETWVPTPTGFTLNGQTCQWQPAAALTPGLPGNGSQHRGASGSDKNGQS